MSRKTDNNFLELHRFDMQDLYKTYRITNKAFLIPEIREWLSQFGSGDIEIAKYLLRCLELVPTQSVSSYFQNIINEKARTSSIAVYCSRQLPKNITSYFDDTGNPIKLSAIPNGSEDVISNIITNIGRTNTNIIIHPKIKKIYRNIIILDDIICSGDRIFNFLFSMVSNGKLDSWLDNKYTKITVISFFKNTNSRSKFEAYKSFSDENKKRCKKVLKKLHFESFKCITPKSGYKNDKLKLPEIYRICHKYCPKKFINSKFGYNEMMSNIVFEFSCPNNTPAILWAYDEKYKPLFKNRGVDSDLFQNLIKKSENYNLRQFLKFKINRKIRDLVERNVIILLCYVKKYENCDYENIKKKISENMNWSMNYVEALLNLALENKYLNVDYKLTGKGSRRLENSKYYSEYLDISLKDNTCYVPKIQR